MIEAMNLAILVAAGLIALSVFTSLISFRVGAPLLLVFLAVGLGAGEDGIGKIHFDNAPAAYFIGSVALALILFDSGFETRLQSFRAAAAPALTLATVGVLMTTALAGIAVHYLFGFGWYVSLLTGAIISSTDAAAVFFLLRVGGITLRDRMRSTLEIESGSNDPIAIFLTLALVDAVRLGTGAEALTWDLLTTFTLQSVIGIAMGLAGGFLIVRVINRVNLDPGLYPVIVLSLALLIFAATGMLEGSGFIAVYVAGMVAGNATLRASALLRRFQSGMTWLAQICMFLTLGLLATPSQFPAVFLPALGVSLALTFLARPVAVWLCLLPYSFSRNETTFVAWVGLRGAVSILLAILPLIAQLPEGRMIFNGVFLIVIFSLLMQGWTIRPLAKWLGLIVPPRIGPVDRVELELPGRANHELVVYRIAGQSPVARGERIPRWARPALIVRGGQSVDIHHAGRLQGGDQVYIFAPPQQVRLLDRLFATPTRLDEDDRDFFGDFALNADAPLAEVADSYGFVLPDPAETRTVGAFLQDAFGGRTEVGDRLPVGGVELIVRAVDDDNLVTEVGLALEPSRGAQPKLPVFQNLSEIAAAIRQRLRERRARLAAAAQAALKPDGAVVKPPAEATASEAETPSQPGEAR